LLALRRCIWIPLCAVVFVSHAADPGERFNQWFAVQTNLQSWSADFIQTRSLKVLAQPLVATGKVWVTTPGLFRWELGQPAQTIALRQPNQLLIIYPRLKRAEKYALSATPTGPLKDALALMGHHGRALSPALSGGNEFPSANDAPAQERLRPQIHQ
jgi:outer membrane lipoprotein-sorting protein